MYKFPGAVWETEIEKMAIMASIDDMLIGMIIITNAFLGINALLTQFQKKRRFSKVFLKFFFDYLILRIKIWLMIWQSQRSVAEWDDDLLLLIVHDVEQAFDAEPASDFVDMELFPSHSSLFLQFLVAPSDVVGSHVCVKVMDVVVFNSVR